MQTESGPIPLEFQALSPVQATLGATDTFQWTIRRRALPSMSKTKSTRKDAGGAVKKSTETISLTWISRNVRQVWHGGFRRRGLTERPTSCSNPSTSSDAQPPWSRFRTPTR